jgi:hypothetical protein
MRLFEIENTIDYTKYSDAINLFKDKKFSLFRGSRFTESSVPIERTPTNRKSRNSWNYIITLMSNLPAWSYYPKRNNAWIMSTSRQYARNYSGTLYYAFPENGSNIGVCSDEDIFTSFNFSSNFYPSFNSRLYDVIRNKSVHIDQNNCDEILNFLKNNWSEFTWVASTFNDFIERFSPEQQKFTLYNTKNWNQLSNRECWTDQKTLFVPREYMETFLDEIGGYTTL